MIPLEFKPPIVKRKSEGLAAFHAYDWYFDWLKQYLSHTKGVFLVPCAATKPIHSSPLHKSIYQKFIKVFGNNREVLVVSEPVVLISYSDLYSLEELFCYDFPPKFLDKRARILFVGRLRALLKGKDIIGCLPKHHASLINDAIGANWKNYWDGRMFSMTKKAKNLNPHSQLSSRMRISYCL